MRRSIYSSLVVLIALIDVSVAPATASTDRRQPTIDDAVALNSPGSIALSPDGALIAIVVAGGISIIRITEPGKVKYELKGSSPSWSPDGRLLAFLVGADGDRQINVWNKAKGTIEVVTDLPGGITSNPFAFLPDGPPLAWSPDSKRLAFCSRELGPSVLRSDPPPRIKVLTTDVSHDLVIEGLFRYDQWEQFQAMPNFGSKQARTVLLDREKGLNKLFVVEAHSHEVHRLTQKGQHFFPSWSPDGTRIACISDSTMGVNWPGPAETQLAIFDVTTGKERRLVPPRQFSGSPQWSPDGTKVVTIGNRRRIGFSDIQLLSVPDGRWSIVKTPKGMNPSGIRWTLDGTAIAGIMADRFMNTLWRIDVRTSASSQVNTNGLGVEGFDITDSGDLSFVASESYHLGRIYVWRHDVADPVLVFDPNPQLANLTFGEQRRVTWKNKAGEEVDGILILPPSYESDHRYPLIVDVYPRPTRDHLMLNAGPAMGQLEAALGYVVLVAGIRAPHAPYNFTREMQYTEKARGPKGIPIMVDDYQSGIEFLVRSGLVDQDRIGVFGHSNGGGVANFLMTEINPGKCVVLSSVAWGDAFFDDLMFAQWGPGRPHPSEYIDGDLYNNIGDYIKMSPIFRLRQANVPILMLGGDKDWFAVMLMTMEFNALRHLGKKVTFVRYSDEGHNVAKIENQRDWRDRIHRFFDEQIKQ